MTHDYPGRDAYYRSPRPEMGGAFDLPEPMPEPVQVAHAAHATARERHALDFAAWAEYADAHPRATEWTIDRLARGHGHEEDGLGQVHDQLRRRHRAHRGNQQQ